MKTVKFIWTELISLLIDDGFLAIAASVAIAVTWLLTRASVVGASNGAGWLLFALLSSGVVISSRRAVQRHLESSD